MTARPPLFAVDDETELLALWRLFAEAKFAEHPDDREIWGSPRVHALSKRMGEALREAARRSSRPDELERHERWVASLRTNVVLPVVKKRLREDAHSPWWTRMSSAEKSGYVRDCVSPFEPDVALIEELVRDAEA